jgi:hypothetical protein
MVSFLHNVSLCVLTRGFIWRIVKDREKTPSGGGGVAMRLRLAGVKPNSDAMRIMISAWRFAIAK